MSFKQKTWNDRISEHPTRRTLTDVSDNTTKTVDVAREEGTISQEGDAYSAANMNDLESRIADGFSTLSQDSLKMSSSNPSSDSIKFGINASGQYGYIKQGASEVTPFRNPTGNASPSDVLSGKTFSTASLENASGTRVDLGSEPEMKGGTLHNGDVYLYPVSGGDGRYYGIRRGVHASPSNIAGWSGGTLFTKSQYDSNYRSGYNNGVRDADNRANSNSTNYKSGYNAGYSALFNAIPVKVGGSASGRNGAQRSRTITVGSAITYGFVFIYGGYADHNHINFTNVTISAGSITKIVNAIRFADTPNVHTDYGIMEEGWGSCEFYIGLLKNVPSRAVITMHADKDNSLLNNTAFLIRVI